MKKIWGLVLLCIFLTGCSQNKEVNLGVDNTSLVDVAAGEDGYYIIENVGVYPGHAYIYYIQENTLKPIVLCNKSDCEHSCSEVRCSHKAKNENCGLKDCDGFVRGYCSPCIKYYDNKIYVLLSDSEGVHLYAINQDGTERKKVCTLEENGNAEIGGFLFNKGMIYYDVKEYNKTDGSDTIKIYKKDISSNSERELVFEQTCSYIVINYMQGYEDGVYFVYGHMTDEESNKAYEENAMAMELYKITEQGTVRVVDSTDVNAYNVDDSMLYYHLSNGEVHCYNMTDGVDEVIYMAEKDMLYSMWMDDEYIYLDNDLGCNVYWFMDERIDRYITVIKKDGTFVRNINIDSDKYSKGILYSRGCDDKYMFFTNFTSWFIYDKSQLETGGNELKKIFGYSN